MGELRDYQAWLDSYDDPDSPLSWRLGQVQEWLTHELDTRTGPLTVLSVCAGDGRDLLEVLAGRPDASRVEATLLELHEDIAQAARDRAQAHGFTGIEVRTTDAGSAGSYVGAVPADVVLLVGVLGNISNEDIARTVAALPQLCRPGATLIWSRGRDRDDLNDQLRADLVRVGFTELAYAELDQSSRPALGAMRYDGPAVALLQDQRLFTFWR